MHRIVRLAVVVAALVVPVAFSSNAQACLLVPLC
jgi:hypothetical protein